jgi:hypothetical protein
VHGRHAQSIETACGCGGPVDRQFLILDPKFSSSDSWWRQRVIASGGAWSRAAEDSGNARLCVEDLMAMNLVDLEFLTTDLSNGILAMFLED